MKEVKLSLFISLFHSACFMDYYITNIIFFLTESTHICYLFLRILVCWNEIFIEFSIKTPKFLQYTSRFYESLGSLFFLSLRSLKRWNFSMGCDEQFNAPKNFLIKIIILGYAAVRKMGFVFALLMDSSIKLPRFLDKRMVGVRKMFHSKEPLIRRWIYVEWRFCENGGNFVENRVRYYHEMIKCKIGGWFNKIKNSSCVCDRIKSVVNYLCDGNCKKLPEVLETTKLQKQNWITFTNLFFSFYSRE